MATTDRPSTEKKRSTKPPRRGGAGSSFGRLADAQAAAGQQPTAGSGPPAARVPPAVPGQPASGQTPAGPAASAPLPTPPARDAARSAAAAPAPPAPQAPSAQQVVGEPAAAGAVDDLGGPAAGGVVPAFEEFMGRVEANRSAAHAGLAPSDPPPGAGTDPRAQAGVDGSGWVEARDVITAGGAVVAAPAGDPQQRPELVGDGATAELVRLVLQLPTVQNQADAATKGTNVQAPGRVIKLLKREAVKPVTHAQVIFRAVDGAVKDPVGFTQMLREWQTRNAEQSAALGLYAPAESLRAAGTGRLQYNPPMWFERQLRTLAAQCGLSKAVFVSLCLVHRYRGKPGIDVSII